MRIGIIAIIIICLSSFVNSQNITFERTYGTTAMDDGHYIQQTEDNGYIVAGETETSEDNYDIFLIRINEIGDTLWTRKFGGPYDDGAYSVKITPDGGYITLGYSETQPGIYKMVLLKTDSNGYELWKKYYSSGDMCFPGYSEGLQLTPEGDFVFIGSYYQNSSEKIVLFKVDASGNVIFSKTYGDNKLFQASSVYNTYDSGYLILSTVADSSFGIKNICLFKLDHTGNQVWYRKFSSYSFQYANTLVQTPNKGFLIAGTEGYFGSGYPCAYFINADSAGNIIWTKRNYGPPQYHGIGCVWIERSFENGYIILGHTNYPNEDLYLFKIDTACNVIWGNSFGGPEQDFGNKLFVTSDDGYAMLGFTYNNTQGNSDVFLVKTKSDGTFIDKPKNFRAIKTASSVKLYWSSNQEYYLSLYKIYVGQDNDTSDMREIATVDKAANYYEDQTSSYTLQCYYWIKALDVYGHSSELTSSSIPGNYALEQNYPNPFNNSTNIKFHIPYYTKIRIAVYDITGKLVKTLYDGYLWEGIYLFTLSDLNLASGVYFYRLESRYFTDAKKLVLVK